MYISMYTTPVMNVSNFRTKLKEMLDMAEQGEVVVIERNGVVFELTRRGKESRRQIPWMGLELKMDLILKRLQGGTPASETPAEWQEAENPREKIRLLEKKRDARLEYMQDPEEAARLGRYYQALIDEEWKKVKVT